RRVNRIKTTLICECEPEFPAALASDPTEVTGKGLCLPICHISCRPYKGCPDVNGFRTSLPSNAEDSHPEPSFALSLFRRFSRRPGPHSARRPTSKSGPGVRVKLPDRREAAFRSIGHFPQVRAGVPLTRSAESSLPDRMARQKLGSRKRSLKGLSGAFWMTATCPRC